MIPLIFTNGGTMKIVTDTAALYTPTEGEKLGLKVFPLSVAINGKTYREFVDIGSEEFLKEVRAGAIPTSSQPPVGEMIELFEEEKEDLIVLSMADGLSGTYQSTVGARNSVKDNEHIHVLNTKTLCGPQHYLVSKALKMKEEGLDTQTIIEEMNRLIESSISFLIPSDFDFLKRGGRLTPLAATIGGMMKIIPVMIQSDDGRRIEKFAIKRTLKKGVDAIIEYLKSKEIDGEYIISISHAGVKEKAEEVMSQIQASLPDCKIELWDLSPAFITQGGPDCIAIQTIKM